MLCSAQRPTKVRAVLRQQPADCFVRGQLTDDEAGFLTKKQPTAVYIQLQTVQLYEHVIGYLLVNIDCTIHSQYTT